MTILLSSLLLIASAETVSYCDSIPMQLTDWNSSVSLPKFDPEMGTLTGVELKCVLNLSQGVSLENMNNNGGNFTIFINGGLLVDLPNSENISINADHSSEGELAGFDGRKDRSGPSGLNRSEVITVEPVIKNYSHIDDFIAGSADEMAILPVTATFMSKTETSGSFLSGISLMAGASVCIFYTYEPNTARKGGN